MDYDTSQYHKNIMYNMYLSYIKLVSEKKSISREIFTAFEKKGEKSQNN